MNQTGQYKMEQLILLKKTFTGHHLPNKEQAQ